VECNEFRPISEKLFSVSANDIYLSLLYIFLVKKNIRSCVERFKTNHDLSKKNFLSVLKDQFLSSVCEVLELKGV